MSQVEEIGQSLPTASLSLHLKDRLEARRPSTRAEFLSILTGDLAAINSILRRCAAHAQSVTSLLEELSTKDGEKQVVSSFNEYILNVSKSSGVGAMNLEGDHVGRGAGDTPLFSLDELGPVLTQYTPSPPATDSDGFPHTPSPRSSVK